LLGSCLGDGLEANLGLFAKATQCTRKRLEKYGERVTIRKGRFSQVIQNILREVNSKEIKGLLADIGVSSLQLDQKERGFSYESDNLDMRMDKDAPLSASHVVNEYSQRELEKIVFEYGELRNYKKIASEIVKNRPFTSAIASITLSFSISLERLAKSGASTLNDSASFNASLFFDTLASNPPAVHAPKRNIVMP